jgi:glycosyltransferase involved in cell wall biosynthesis
MLPLVSCIMPTHKRRHFVPQAIRYFLRQNYPNKELVILDDGSESVADLVPADPQVRYIRLSGSRTLGAKRNACVEASQGDLIMHWDDDDWMASHRIAYQVEALLQAGAEVCGLRCMLFYELETDRGWLYTYPTNQRPWLAGGSLLYTRYFWRRSPFPNIQIGSDTRFMWSQRLHRSVALPDYTFYVAMIHPSNTSPKHTGTHNWCLANPGEVRALLGEDYTFYCGLRSASSARNSARPSSSQLQRRPLYNASVRFIPRQSRNEPKQSEMPGEAPPPPAGLTIKSSMSEQRGIELKGSAQGMESHWGGGWRNISEYGQDNLLSVLMSAYGTGRWIGAAVASVLSQELPRGWELELIIGIDGCAEALREALRVEDARVVVLELTENGGTYRALNTSLRYARGALIAILDSDDIAMPGRFRDQIEELQRHPEIALLGGQVRAINERGEFLPNKLHFPLDASSGFRRGGDYTSYLVSHPTWMVRRKTYAQLGGYVDSKVGSDAEFCLRAVALGLHCRSLPDHITLYRQRDGQLTRASRTNFRSEVRRQMIEKIRRDAEAYRQGETPRPVEPVGTSVNAVHRKGRTPVLAVMPTIPARQRTARLVVQTLLQQQVDRFVVFLNGYPSNFSISDDPRMLPILTPFGTGPIVRYREGALGHSVVLTVDDDLVYPSDYVKVALRHLATLGRGIAISYHAAVWNSQDKSYAARSLLHYTGEYKDFMECNYLGSGTAVFWGEDFESLREEPPAILEQEDDIWMSAQLQRRGIRLVRPPSKRNWLRSQPEACDATALYTLASKDGFKAREQAIAFAEAEFGWSRGPGRPFLRELPIDGSLVSRSALQPDVHTVLQPEEVLSTARHPVDMRAFWLHRFKTVHGIGAVANLSFSKEQNERDYARCQAFMARQLREDCGGKAPESLLDLGYGQGHYAHVAHEIGVRRYVGLDFAAPPLSMPGDYHFLEQDICEKGFDLGEKFEVVLLLDVAFHVIDDLAFEHLLANISRHARGVVYITGLFRDQRIAMHVLHRRLECFHPLGIVTAIYPWRDVLLARITVR